MNTLSPFTVEPVKIFVSDVTDKYEHDLDNFSSACKEYEQKVDGADNAK